VSVYTLSFAIIKYIRYALWFVIGCGAATPLVLHLFPRFLYSPTSSVVLLTDGSVGFGELNATEQALPIDPTKTQVETKRIVRQHVEDTAEAILEYCRSQPPITTTLFVTNFPYSGDLGKQFVQQLDSLCPNITVVLPQSIDRNPLKISAHEPKPTNGASLLAVSMATEIVSSSVPQNTQVTIYEKWGQSNHSSHIVKNEQRTYVSVYIDHVYAKTFWITQASTIHINLPIRANLETGIHNILYQQPGSMPISRNIVVSQTPLPVASVWFHPDMFEHISLYRWLHDTAAPIGFITKPRQYTNIPKHTNYVWVSTAQWNGLSVQNRQYLAAQAKQGATVVLYGTALPVDFMDSDSVLTGLSLDPSYTTDDIFANIFESWHLNPKVTWGSGWQEYWQNLSDMPQLTHRRLFRADDSWHAYLTATRNKPNTQNSSANEILETPVLVAKNMGTGNVVYIAWDIPLENTPSVLAIQNAYRLLRKLLYFPNLWRWDNQLRVESVEHGGAYWYRSALPAWGMFDTNESMDIVTNNNNKYVGKSKTLDALALPIIALPNMTVEQIDSIWSNTPQRVYTVSNQNYTKQNITQDELDTGSNTSDMNGPSNWWSAPTEHIQWYSLDTIHNWHPHFYNILQEQTSFANSTLVFYGVLVLAIVDFWLSLV
jgi:hypothetical protein